MHRVNNFKFIEDAHSMVGPTMVRLESVLIQSYMIQRWHNPLITAMLRKWKRKKITFLRRLPKNKKLRSKNTI